MDPNATLETLRHNLSEPENVDGEIVAELFLALDEWLSKGGFLPDAWAH